MFPYALNLYLYVNYTPFQPTFLQLSPIANPHRLLGDKQFICQILKKVPNVTLIYARSLYFCR